MTREFVVVVVLAVLTVGAEARAADPVVQKVKKLYESGKAHYDLGEWSEALADYKEAFRLRSDPAFLFNIGQCYRKLGDPEKAALEYRAYLRDEVNSPNRVEVEKLIGEMDRASAEKRANQPPTGIAPPHLDSPPPRDVTPPPPPGPTPPPAEAPRAPYRTAGLGAAIAGLVVLATGGILTGVAVSTAGGANESATLGDRNGTLDTAGLERAMGIACLAVGAAALAIGVVLILLPARRERTAAALQIVPALGGVSLRASF